MAVVVLLRAGRIRLAVFLIVTALLGSLIDTVVKIVVDRPRPVLLDPVAHRPRQELPVGPRHVVDRGLRGAAAGLPPGGRPPVAAVR